MLFANWSAAIYMLLICAYFFSEILDLHDLIFMFEDLYIATPWKVKIPVQWFPLHYIKLRKVFMHLLKRIIYTMQCIRKKLPVANNK